MWLVAVEPSLPSCQMGKSRVRGRCSQTHACQWHVRHSVQQVRSEAGAGESAGAGARGDDRHCSVPRRPLILIYFFYEQHNHMHHFVPPR
jgi:hypothetical protein